MYTRENPRYVIAELLLNLRVTDAEVDVTVDGSVLPHNFPVSVGDVNRDEPS